MVGSGFYVRGHGRPQSGRQRKERAGEERSIIGLMSGFTRLESFRCPEYSLLPVAVLPGTPEDFTNLLDIDFKTSPDGVPWAAVEVAGTECFLMPTAHAPGSKLSLLVPAGSDVETALGQFLDALGIPSAETSPIATAGEAPLAFTPQS